MDGFRHNKDVVSFLTGRDRMALGTVSKAHRYGDDDGDGRIRDIRLAVFLGPVTASRPYDWAYTRNLDEFVELPFHMQTPSMFVAGLRRRGYRARNSLWLEMPCQHNWANALYGDEDDDLLHSYSTHGRVVVQIDGALSPALTQLFYDFPGAPPDLAAYLVPEHAAFPSGAVPRASVMTDARGPYAAFYAVPTCHDEHAWNESACLEPGGCIYEGEAQAWDARFEKRARH